MRHIVELHGGAVVAESAGADLGAAFTVTLPLTTGARPRGAAKSKGAAKEAPASAAVLTGVRVLVVDDDHDARELLELSLRESGADVRAACSARAALDALRPFRPDLLLSDIGMPGEDGDALSRQVRARVRRGRPPPVDRADGVREPVRSRAGALARLRRAPGQAREPERSLAHGDAARGPRLELGDFGLAREPRATADPRRFIFCYTGAK